ncbi:23S rRNA (uracil(1939)-C(5))-methyltransferase RlmD [uncultured Eubacterium sp.]|uniref:23S rRNA (uracil(1939)-C(5))-methyltransferase RlmD n=1 Tax=uncultured Eubacterium sp. TaxID=165185 RepID=UPI0025EA1A0A|nr:23S rRNA (uracil(1939)-C(5))-methyltransferase RlmD [uncultured Eubacterium sp.]
MSEKYTDRKNVSKGYAVQKHSNDNKKNEGTACCKVAKKCGGCQYQGIPYEKQLQEKQKAVRQLMQPFCKTEEITGMKDPYHYRNKVHAVFARKKDGTIISGVYEEGTHRVVPVEACQIEDEKADAIINDIRGLLKSFKIKTYNEDTDYGLLRHVLIRRGFTTGEIMVVLVLGSPVMPSKNNFVKALRKLHPEITTVVLNVNDKRTSMVLGDRETTIYGKGYIEDVLCGLTFRISSKSFYQINSVQTEKLYEKAMELAGLTGKERVIDAYCGIGTIGMVAAKSAKEVIGVELNPDAVRDAVKNAKRNQMKNIRFYQDDAGRFMEKMAANGEKADVVFMDPPRSGSTEQFMKSAVTLAPKKIVYISCDPQTQARDLKYLTRHGYKAMGAYPYDMFPFTKHAENIVLLVKNGRDKENVRRRFGEEPEKSRR